ncbi:glycosyltransferase [Empedobacter falsenii]
MKILQVIDSLPSTSGGSRFVVNLSKKLQQLGIDVTLLLIDGKKTHFVNEIIESGIKYIFLDESTKSRYKFKYIKQISKIMKNYDIVHVHIFPTSYLVALSSLFSRTKAKIVFTEHNAFNKRATNKLFVYIEKFIYGRFDKIIGITPEVKVFINRYITNKKNKIDVITNGIDLNNINKTVAAKRIDFNFEEKDIICLMAARFSFQKDHETLIKSFVNLPVNFKLILAGDGANLNKCIMLVEQLNLKDKVKFIGSRDDIYSIIKMSDINILSSRYEGFGLSIVEAMALNKVVIGSNVDGMNNIIENAGFLFEVGDYKELHNLILDLGTNKSLYNKVALQCKLRSNDFSLEKMVNQYIDVYKRLLNE